MPRCFFMSLLLRCLIFICVSTWTWRAAAWSSLAFLHELDAPLLDLHLHFCMNLMARCFFMNLLLRCLIFSCVSTWTWCSAAWFSLAFLHELDAPLLLHELVAPLLCLQLRFYMNLMPRCMLDLVCRRENSRRYSGAVRTSDRHAERDRQSVAARPSPSDHRRQSVAVAASPSDRQSFAVRPLSSGVASRHVMSRHVVRPSGAPFESKQLNLKFEFESIWTQIAWTLESQINDWLSNHLKIEFIDSQIACRLTINQLTTKSLESQSSWIANRLNLRSVESQTSWISNDLTTKTFESQINGISKQLSLKSLESQTKSNAKQLNLKSIDFRTNWIPRLLPVGSLSLETSATASCGRYVNCYNIVVVS